jgi:hypothetical protein
VLDQNRPSLDLSPIVLEGRKSLSGSEGQIRCLPQPEQLGHFAPIAACITD